MDAYDSLPKDVRLLIDTAPVKLTVRQARDLIDKHGVETGSRIYLFAVAKMWRDLGATPLRL